MSESESQTGRLRLGTYVFLGLAVLTIVEFWVSAALENPLPLLAIIGLGKAWAIIRYFMHVAQLWRQEADS